jgi:secreted trypsin-like serine protease
MKYFTSKCLLVIVALSSHALSQESSNFEDRIINGKTIAIEDRPFMAAIVRDDAVVCTGIVVTSFWVLTCAHCYSAKSKNTKDNTKVAVGSSKALDNSVLISVVKIVPHPLFSHTELYHDIAMVKTHDEIQMSSKVQPAVLAEGHDGTPGILSLCQTIGFGSAVSDSLVIEISRLH